MSADAVPVWWLATGAPQGDPVGAPVVDLLDRFVGVTAVQVCPPDPAATARVITTVTRQWVTAPTGVSHLLVVPFAPKFGTDTDRRDRELAVAAFLRSAPLFGGYLLAVTGFGVALAPNPALPGTPSAVIPSGCATCPDTVVSMCREWVTGEPWHP